MSVVVVAVLTPKPGHTQSVLDAFSVVSPLVHEEAGCELYAAHTDGEQVVMIERWSTKEDLGAHAAGQPITQLNRLNANTLAAPAVVSVLENVPFGEPTKGTIQ